MEGRGRGKQVCGREREEVMDETREGWTGDTCCGGEEGEEGEGENGRRIWGQKINEKKRKMKTIMMKGNERYITNQECKPQALLLRRTPSTLHN